MDNDWELSKENIQPRKEGRDIKKLVAGLTPSKEETVLRINEMHEYELAIRINDKEDQLDIWHRYVIWTEQNFPLGSGNELKNVLERCIRQFHKNEKYKEDKRLVWIFLKYADILMEPGDVFDYMFDQKIGLTHASFYECWATLLEMHSNYKRADEVYGIGIARNAQPLCSLERNHQQFLKRFAAKVKEEVDEGAMKTKAQRESLVALKKTSRGKVGLDRVKGKSTKIKGGIGSQTVNNQLQGGTFAIFEDGKSATSSLPSETGEWMNPPEHSKMVKENIQKPGKWTNAKMPDTKANHASGPAFAIHEDDQPKVISSQALKQVILSERKPLTSRKIPKEGALANPMKKILKEDDCQFVVRYRKNEVYQGSYEFSFEELRALEPKYSLGTCTDYNPYAMQETCIMSPMSITEVAVPDEPQSRMDINACLPKNDDIAADVARTAGAASIFREEPATKPSIARQRLCFSVEKEEVPKDIVQSTEFDQNQQLPVNIKNIPLAEESLVLPNVPCFQTTFDNDDVTDFTANIGVETLPMAFCKDERTRNWDITEIEGINNKTDKYLGPTESTNVHYDLAFARKTSVKDDSITGSVQQESIKTIPLLDDQNQRTLKCTGDTSDLKGFSEDASTIQNIPQNIFGGKLLPIINEIPQGKPSEPQAPLSAAGPNKQVESFSIFSDSCPDIAMVAPRQQAQSLKNDGTVNVTCNAMKKDGLSIEQPILKPEVKPPPLQMKRLPCKELTPITEHKQARIGDVDRFGPIWVPSPTVHTKKAKQEVLAMFNMTLECEKNEFTLNTTQEVTNRYDQQTMEPKELAPAYQAPKTDFEIFEEKDDDDERVVPNDGKIQRQSLRDKGPCIKYTKTPCGDSDLHSSSLFRNFSSSHDTVTASTFCYPAAAPPLFSAEIGDLECTNRNDTSKTMDYRRNGLSPIEELSGEEKGATSVSTNNSCSNNNGADSVSQYHLPPEGCSQHEKERMCTREESGDHDAPPVFEISICSNQPCCEMCPQHGIIADALEYSFANYSMLPSCNQIEEGMSTLAIDTTSLGNGRSNFEPTPVDPAKEIAAMMTAMDFENYPTLYIDNDNELKQKFAVHSKVTLGAHRFIIQKKIASGGFSVVYASSNLDIDEGQVALKVMKSPESCQWEFYIGEEIHRRIDENEYDPSLHQDFVRTLSGYVYSDGAVIQYPFFPGGTLLDLVNKYVSKKEHLNETFALLYGLNVCKIVKALHDLSIIHGDVKPDNFLLKPISGEVVDGNILNCLTLTDFGKCIDLSWFPNNVTFTGRSNTDKFECIEMQKSRPWKYQIDYYGIACTLHVVHHGTYMECFEMDGRYKPTKAFRRPVREFWSSVFDRLINVPNCHDTTILDGIIKDFSTKLAEPNRRKELEEILTFHSHVVSSYGCK